MSLKIEDVRQRRRDREFKEKFLRYPWQGPLTAMYPSGTLRDEMAAASIDKVGAWPEHLDLQKIDSPSFVKYAKASAKAAYLLADALLEARKS